MAPADPVAASTAAANIPTHTTNLIARGLYRHPSVRPLTQTG
jgi:hypothetical protein